MNQSAIESTSNAVVGLALFGLGRMGKIFFTRTREIPNLKLIYIIKNDTAAGRSFLTENGAHEVEILHSSLIDKAVADSRVHAVIIASSSETHEDITLKAISQGKSVFCEKPLTSSFNLAKAKEIFSLANANSILLHLGFQRRFDVHFKDVWDRVRSNEIGKLQTIRICSRDPTVDVNYLKTSGGILFDAVIHDFDMLLWLTQDDPVSVYMTGHAHNPDIAVIPDLDVAVIVIKFKSGTIGMIEVCREAHFGYDQRLEVFGSKGMLTVDNPKLSSVKSFTKGSFSASLSYDYFMDRYHQAYINELDHFIAAIKGHEVLSVTADQVIAGMKLVDAATQSLREGKAVCLS